MAETARDGPARVLLVDDDEDDALLVREHLRRWRSTALVSWAPTAEEAVRRLEAERFDLALIDYRLPGEDGLWLTRRIQDLPEPPPVVMLTGRGDQEVAVQAMQAGASDYLSKARMDAERLASWMRHALELHAARQGQRRVEEELRQAQKMEAVGRLAAGIAHDFNNLLTAVVGYTYLAVRKLPDDHPALRDLEQIRAAADRATSLTQQLLAYGRKQILSPAPLDMNAVVSGLAPILRRVIGEPIHLRLALAPDVGTTLADRGQMEQVLMNLVLNARDAMPQGGDLIIETSTVTLGRDYVTQRVGVEPGRYVLLAVSDTGVGMDGETLAHVFEPFFTTKPKGQGTGLGLATAYGIVKQTGGNVTVYSEPGRGSAFKVYLPLTEATVSPDAPATPRGGAVAARPATILLVEDEDAVRWLASEVLRGAGYDVIVAPDAERGLEMARRHAGRIDLLLTDVVLPGADGRELAERLLQDRPGTPVIYMSGYAEAAVVGHGVLQRQTAFVPKPFPPEVLLQAVHDALAKGGGAEAHADARE